MGPFGLQAVSNANTIFTQKYVYLQLCYLQELRLDKSSTFRDLSKPLGAQTEERLMQFKKRYDEWEDPTGERSWVKQGGQRSYMSLWVIIVCSDENRVCL